MSRGPIQYGPNGCQVNVGGSQMCGETQTLDIIKEFNRLYESKMQELNRTGGGDNLLAKVNLQQNWIRDLTEQNDMLVSAVEELEKEAAERVSLLEERLESGAKAMQDVQKLDTKLVEMEKRLSLSPKDTDVQELNFKLHLKDEELNSIKRRSVDIESDSTDLRKKLKELEKENTTLKDTIFQANRELEKFYEQANDYLKDRDEYKRKFKESTVALTTAQNQFTSEKQSLERKVLGQEQTIKKLITEDEQIKAELTNSKRQSESLSQAQNETIQALQEAIHDKDKASKVVRVMPLKSDESWTSTTDSTASRTPRDKTSAYNTPFDQPYGINSTNSVGMSTEQEVPSKEFNRTVNGVCSEHPCPPTCVGMEELNKLREERDLERVIHKQEVENLKKTITELEKGGQPQQQTQQQTQQQSQQQPQQQTQQQSQQQPQQHLLSESTSENNQLQGKVEKLECECDAMRRIVNEAKELHQSFILMEATKDDLQLEAEQARKELMREAQFKNINNARIDELQSRLGKKTYEINRCDHMLRDLQSKLCWTVCQNSQLKNEISTLLTHVSNYQQNYIDNDERTDICQKEIEVCKENLTDLKDKLLMMKGLLQQKIDQYSQLETEFCLQNNCLACMKEEMCLNEKQYEDEASDLRDTIDELQTKLLETEATCKCLREDYERSQAAVQEYNWMESKLQDKFTNSLSDAENEIVTLNNYVGQLKEECSYTRKELKVKEQQIGAAKAQIAHFQTSENANLLAAQDEINKLRNELNVVLQQHDVLNVKNEALCMQLCEVKQNAIGFERQTEINEHHLHKCLCELQHLRQVKEQLETANDQLRCAYHELCQKYQQVAASVSILNSETVEYKSKNQDLLIESRNLINNVRSWLENQALINQQVTQKLNDDHLIIQNLSQKIVALKKCKCGHSSRLHAGSNEGTLADSLPSDATLESESQSYTVIDNSDECSLDNYEFNQPHTKTWLKKIESMTKELHKSSEYWQSKMSDDYLVTKDQ